jgi:ArsR family transcriptional regulator, arsenate/arsenite/antimonite-responsive transcriptional repressor
MRNLAAIFKALADETRLQMLGLLLKEGELCVCDFVAVLKVSQSKASRHLRYLVHAGLLEDRREAVWVHFRTAENPGPQQRAVLADLQRLLPHHLSAPMLAALKTWRKSKCRGGLACRPASVKTKRTP